MFLGVPSKIAYTDPWLISFEDKFATLLAGEHKLAYFYEKPDSSTFRYRAFNMIECVNGCLENFSAAHFTADELPAMERVVKAADSLIICRAGYTDLIMRLILQAKAAGCKVFYDVDDLIFDIDHLPLVMETLSEEPSENRLDRYFAYMSRLGAVLKLCDAVIVTNQRLADRVREFIDLPVHVLPNFMNDAQMNLSKEVFKQKSANQFERDSKLHIGYFSGSPTHNKDFQIVSPLLAKLLEQDSRIILRLGGYLETPELESYKSRIERFPMMDFLNLQLMQASTEINLVPLQSNLFTDCKSDLKYFEAGIVGTISVASPVFAYRNSIKDGVNGYLADESAWKDKLSEALATVENGYQEMASAAFADCQSRYSKEAQTQAIQSVFS